MQTGSPFGRLFFVLFFWGIAQIVSAQGKSEADFAAESIVLRLTVTPEPGSRLKMELLPVIRDTFNLDTVTGYMIGWKEPVFKALLSDLHKKVWRKYTTDSISIFSRLDKQLQESYASLYQTYQQQKFEQLTSGENSLSSSDQELYKDYVDRLAKIQDTIGLAKKLLQFRKKNDHSFYFSGEDNSSFLDKLRLIEFVKREKIDEGFLNSQFDTKPDQYLQLYSKLLIYDTLSLRRKLDTLALIQGLLQKSIRRINTRRDHLIHLIGDANVVSSFKNASTTQVNAGFGLYAVRPGFSEFYGVITLAQAQEDSTTEYGPSVLVPGVRRFSLLTSYRSYSIMRYSSSSFLRRVGFGFDVNITPYRWINPDTSVKAIPFAVNLLLPYTWVHQSKAGQDYAISTDIGMSVRYIGGDISRDQIGTFLGNNRRWYVGPILGINIKYNALRAQFHAPLFFSKDQNRVKGLTNGQVFASIGILANLSGDIGKVIRGND